MPTSAARGPWDPEALHGGPVVALAVRAMEQLAEGRLLGRITCEFLRPVPMRPLSVESVVVQRGRSVTWLRATVSFDERPVAEATAVAMRRRAFPVGAYEGPPPGPEEGALAANPSHVSYESFVDAGMEVRFVRGSLLEPGPATAWFRMALPLLPGENPSPFVRVAAAADFSNGASAIVPWDEFTFINPDLTIYLHREPSGAWICLEGTTEAGPDSTAVARSRLYDMEGPIGTALQSVLLDPLPNGLPGPDR